MEVGELLEDERNVVERQRLALIKHVEGAEVTVLDILEDNHATLGILAREPAEPGEVPRAAGRKFAFE